MSDSPITDLVRSYPELEEFRSPLEALATEISSPSLSELRRTVKFLIGLQHNLGDGWEMLVVSEELNRLERLLAALDRIPECNAEHFAPAGLTGTHPIWATLVSVTPAFDAMNCLLGLALHLRLRERPTAPEQIESALRSELSRQKESKPLLDVLADTPPQPTPELFYKALMGQEVRLRQLRPALLSALQAAAKRLDWAAPSPEDDEDEEDELEIVSVPLDTVAPEFPGEPLDEILSPRTVCELNEEESSQGIFQQFIHAAERYRSANGLWVDNHVTSLTPEEASELVEWLMKRARRSLKSGEKKKATPAILALTMLMTGRKTPEALRALQPTTDRSSVRVRFGLGFCSIRFPIPQPKNGFSPQLVKEHLYTTPSRTIHVPVPERIQKLFNQWNRLSESPFLISDEEHRSTVIGLLRKFRTETSIPITIGQIPRTLGVFVYSECRDPIIAQWLTDDLNGHSQMPAYYLCLNEPSVRQPYVDALWPILSPKAKKPPIKEGDFVGVKGRLKDDFVKTRTAALTHPFRRPGFREDRWEDVVDRHNQLVFYVTSMLVGLVGHRPVSRLFTLKRWDFDLDLGIGLISDKHSDPAHIYRPVALGRQVTIQLQIYERHLLKLRTIGAAFEDTYGPELTAQIDAALAGDAPWFFRIDRTHTCARWPIRSWRRKLEKAFAVAEQPQFGRTLLASQFRESTPKTFDHYGASRAELAHMQLGHFGLVGMPFDHDSPTTLSGFAKAANPIMDELFKRQGWTIQGGLIRSEERNSPKWRVIHHLSWFDIGAAEQKRSKAIAEWAQRDRKARKDYLKRATAQYRDFLIDRADAVSPPLAKRLDDQAKGEKVPEEKPEPISLSPEQILKILDVGRKDRPAVTNILDNELRKLSERGLYRGAFPKRFAVRTRPDRTRFMPGMFRARYLLEGLRKSLLEHQASALLIDQTHVPEEDLARVIIALILYGGITQHEALAGIIDHRDQAIPNPQLPDCILVPVHAPRPKNWNNPNPDPRPPVTWALWHVAAACLLRFAQEHTTFRPNIETLLEDERFNKQIGEILTPYVSEPPDDESWIDALLAHAKVVRSIETSGIGEFALDVKKGSWSLLLSRQYPFLANKPDIYSEKIKLPRTKQAPVDRETQRFLRSIYHEIPSKERSMSGKDSQEFNRLYRGESILRIEALLSEPSLTQLQEALARHAVELLKTTRAESRDLLDFDSIHTKLSTIGQKIISEFCDLRLDQLDRDDYEQRYHRIAHQTESNQQVKNISRELALFHRTVQKRFGAPPVSRKTIEGVIEKSSIRVDTRVVSPMEAEQAREFLERIFEPPGGNTRSDNRIGLQTLILLSSALTTGARTGEIRGIRHKDIYEASGKRFVILRKSLFREEKSKAAKRRICLTDRLSDRELARISDYLEGERRRLPDLHSSAGRMIMLLPSADTNRRKGSPLHTELVRDKIAVALARYCPGAHGAYQLRHALGTRTQLDMALGTQQGIITSRADHGLRFEINTDYSITIPRDTKRATQIIGHGRFRVINQSYGHMPWSYLHNQAALFQRQLDPKILYFLTGKSQTAASKAFTTHGKNLPQKYLPKVCCQKAPPAVREVKNYEDELYERASFDLDPQALFLIELTQRARPEDHEIYGVSEKQYQALADAAKQVAATTGIAFYPDHHELGNSRASKSPKISEEAKPLLDIASWRQVPHDDLLVVLRSHLMLCDETQRQRIRLSPKAVSALEQVFKKRNLTFQVKVVKKDTHRQTVDIQTPEEKSVNHVLAWVLAICAVLIQAQSYLETQAGSQELRLF